MITEFYEINDLFSVETSNIFRKAGETIVNGGLVAFPTETVYGLGANAFDEKAAAKIYEAKGRPSDNPLIVHIADIKDLEKTAAEISPTAKKLIEKFWPGPLTLIFKKKDCISYRITGGLDTVAVRFPKNKIAQMLIKSAGVPIAAPSANSSGLPSPTSAFHVKADLDGKINMIIDGGNCEYGLESTIVDTSGEKTVLLRPGSITKEMIESLIGPIDVDKAVKGPLQDGELPKAPGMKYKHYSPKAEVAIILGENEKVAEKINELAARAKISGIKTCVLASEENKKNYGDNDVIVLGSLKDPKSIAVNLFAVLRKCDIIGYSKVYSEGFAETDIGLAIMNRLKKAAGYNIIEV